MLNLLNIVDAMAPVSALQPVRVRAGRRPAERRYGSPHGPRAGSTRPRRGLARFRRGAAVGKLVPCPPHCGTRSQEHRRHRRHDALGPARGPRAGQRLGREDRRGVHRAGPRRPAGLDVFHHPTRTPPRPPSRATSWRPGHDPRAPRLPPRARRRRMPPARSPSPDACERPRAPGELARAVLRPRPVAAVAALAALLHTIIRSRGSPSSPGSSSRSGGSWWGFTWYSAAFNDDDTVNRVRCSRHGRRRRARGGMTARHTRTRHCSRSPTRRCSPCSRRSTPGPGCASRRPRALPAATRSATRSARRLARLARVDEGAARRLGGRDARPDGRAGAGRGVAADAVLRRAATSPSATGCSR